jgi:hypothetical protein
MGIKGCAWHCWGLALLWPIDGDKAVLVSALVDVG